MTVDYTYDGLDRLLTVSATNDADGEGILYTLVYDERGEVGLLTTVLEPERATEYDYDVDGRVSTETATVSGAAASLVTSYGYDVDGALETVTYPSGLRIQYVRDLATKEVSEIRDLASGAKYASGVTYWPGGPLRSLTFGNGQTLTQSFDLRYQPDVISSGPVSLDYTMSPAGNVKRIDEGSIRHSYGYDFMGRLAEFAPGHTPADALTHQYTRDRIKQSLAADGTRRYAYAYDYQGNVSAIGRYDPAGSVVQTAVCLKHDALGRLVLVGATNPANVAPDGVTCTAEAQVTSVIARYKYDLWNRRVARWLASTGTWTYFANAPDGNPLSEMTLTASPASPWAPARDYVWLDSRPLAHVEYPGPAGSNGGYRYHYHLDHIGLPRALTSQTGQVVWRASQPRPYGDIVESTTPDPVSGRTVVTNLRLPGQYDERLLGSVGLQGPYYNWNRWYLAGPGRFLEVDPSALLADGHQSAPQWYAYGLDSPLVQSDPTGRDPLTPEPRGGPPIPPPGGGEWKFNPDPNNERGGVYRPDKDHPPGTQKPSISWEPEERGHWDLDYKGTRTRYDRWGNPLTPDEAHQPRPRPGWLPSFPRGLYPLIFVNPCLIYPELCRKKQPGEKTKLPWDCPDQA